MVFIFYTIFFFYSGFVIYLFYGYQHSTEAMKPTNLAEGDTTVVQETPEIERNIATLQPQWRDRSRPINQFRVIFETQGPYRHQPRAEWTTLPK